MKEGIQMYPTVIIPLRFQIHFNSEVWEVCVVSDYMHFPHKIWKHETPKPLGAGSTRISTPITGQSYKQCYQGAQGFFISFLVPSQIWFFLRLLFSDCKSLNTASLFFTLERSTDVTALIKLPGFRNSKCLFSMHLFLLKIATITAIDSGGQIVQVHQN